MVFLKEKFDQHKAAFFQLFSCILSRTSITFNINRFITLLCSPQMTKSRSFLLFLVTSEAERRYSRGCVEETL